MTDHYQDNIKETVQMSVELDGVIWSLTEKENNNKPCLAKGYVIKKESEGEQAIHWLKKDKEEAVELFITSIENELGELFL